MMVDDFGGYPPRDAKDVKIDEQLKIIGALDSRNKELQAQIDEFNKAPLRRMWNGFKDFWNEWFGVGVIVIILCLGILAAHAGLNYDQKKQIGSCEFAAKIQNTKFEFDTYNDKCYIYDKKFEKFIPHATKAP